MSKEAQNNPIDTVVGVLDDCIGRIHDWFGRKGIRPEYSIRNARNVAIKILENLKGIGTPAGEPNFAKDLEEIRRRLSDYKNEQIKQRLKVIEQRVVDVVTFTNYPNASPPSALLGNMKEELEGLRADLVCWTGVVAKDTVTNAAQQVPTTKKANGDGKAEDTSGGESNLAKVPISKLIKQGESQILEFKETLEYDTKENKKNKDVLFSSLKTVAGFLNAKSGTLLIGVDDSGNIKGIERDFSIMKHGNKDRFELKIRNCLKDRFKPQPISKVNISFEKFTERTICRVDVYASQEITHLDNEVYVRDGNTTQKLEGQSLTDWIEQRLAVSKK